MLKNVKLAAVLCALAVPFAAVAAGPTGFSGQDRPGAPQGFNLEKMASISQLKSQAKDDQVVVIEGRFTKQIEKDKFEFTDAKGQTILVELDDDRNWSHVRKDALVELTAEVDKDFTSTELDALQVKALQ
jgi:uncharacterized protein (TIGR00156 family)|nr:MAG TPA: periplasmic protein [Caudoviricetes sp.]